MFAPSSPSSPALQSPTPTGSNSPRPLPTASPSVLGAPEDRLRRAPRRRRGRAAHDLRHHRGRAVKLVCPQQATAALVPTGSDNPKCTVQFDDGASVPDDLPKVVNTEVGLDGAYILATADGHNALTWSSKGPSNGVQFLAIDEVNDVLLEACVLSVA
ncbi:hypothetical protein K523DRAFT_353033 [Schizophyllum commune Tattone D]|nr:hypothetical protein K525DRAFT_269463 [Schizophyllum commune Loenen D]KAI5828910.1 hypothetical protein K523DRAFT_353033 [Schizophyllum commune Tattone D]